MRCSACGFAFDARNPSAASTAQIALARFENTLRNSISKDNVFGIRQETGCLRFAQDVAWALMRPVHGTRYRVAHFFEGCRFSMPSGINTPADVPDWLSCGPIILRRHLLSLVAALYYSDCSSESIALAGKSHKELWTGLRSNLVEQDALELKKRAVRWNLAMQDELDFCWSRHSVLQVKE